MLVSVAVAVTADLIEGGEDQANEALVQHLIGGLCLDVHMGRQDCDVGVGVIPANDTGLNATLARELLCCCSTPRQLLRTGFHPILECRGRYVWVRDANQAVCKLPKLPNCSAAAAAAVHLTSCSELASALS